MKGLYFDKGGTEGHGHRRSRWSKEGMRVAGQTTARARPDYSAARRFRCVKVAVTL
ncbi:hypothetical protein SJ05684_b59240 (plasmid) [Sinorhizobium sojae CCBAU 05684]|uniref:Uncharacterized protein n=1 Tax=Sinorhizobium sojae CCBAU 05684 TaxID=716928 RepID=A0A249PM64_9HYPH|nr:hypothetical protein SJ05684_b59240 [Sinorhizobium sojae CCBAU 05684]